MRSRKFIAWFIFAAFIISAGAWKWHTRDPICSGQPASYWLLQYEKSQYNPNSEAAAKLKECGNKLIPYLRQKLSSRISAYRFTLLKFLPKRSAAKYAPGSLYPDQFRAVKALQLLGPDALKAQKELIEFFKTGNSASLQFEIYQLFRALGPQGAAPMRANLSHPDEWVRFHCASVLLLMDKQDPAAIQTLTTLSASTNQWIAGVASNTLPLLQRDY